MGLLLNGGSEGLGLFEQLLHFGVTVGMVAQCDVGSIQKVRQLGFRGVILMGNGEFATFQQVLQGQVEFPRVERQLGPL